MCQPSNSLVRTVIGRPRGGALLIGGREVAMIFADVRLRGVMDGIDLAREAKMRWPLLPVILTSGHPRERLGELPPGVAYMPKPWQPLNVLTRELGGRARPVLPGLDWRISDWGGSVRT